MLQRALSKCFLKCTVRVCLFYSITHSQTVCVDVRRLGSYCCTFEGHWRVSQHTGTVPKSNLSHLILTRLNGKPCNPWWGQMRLPTSIQHSLRLLLLSPPFRERNSKQLSGQYSGLREGNRGWVLKLCVLNQQREREREKDRKRYTSHNQTLGPTKTEHVPVCTWTK